MYVTIEAICIKMCVKNDLKNMIIKGPVTGTGYLGLVVGTRWSDRKSLLKRKVLKRGFEISFGSFQKDNLKITSKSCYGEI
jgi:hypothetical protein